MSSVELITEIETLVKLLPEWEQLGDSLLPWTPFATPAWLLTWWKCFRRDTAFARDELHSYAIRDAAGKLIGICPMMLTMRPGMGPFQTRELQFLGSDPNITELRGPICARENAGVVTAALLQHFRSSRPAHWIQCRGFPDIEELSARCGIIADPRLEAIDYYLDLPETWEDLKKKLPRNIKESIRKCYNSLSREGHSFDFRIVQDADEIDAALDTFFELHARRADLERTVDHPNVFATLKSQAFLREFCSSRKASCDVIVFQLTIAHQTVATRIGFVSGKQIYLYFSGYDPEWRRHSVMTTTLVEIIKWSIVNGFKVCNLSPGTDVSKTRWRPESITFHGGYMPGNALVAKLIVPAAEIRHRSRIGAVIRAFT